MTRTLQQTIPIITWELDLVPVLGVDTEADLAAPGSQHRGRRGGGGGGGDLLRLTAHPRPPGVGQAAQGGKISTQTQGHHLMSNW